MQRHRKADIKSFHLKNGIEVKDFMSNNETKDVQRASKQSGASLSGDKKEEERMQKTDMDAQKKAATGAHEAEAGKQPETADKAVEGDKPKKKNIISLFRPQNSKTGMVKPSGRSRQQGGKTQSGSKPAQAKTEHAPSENPAKPATAQAPAKTAEAPKTSAPEQKAPANAPEVKAQETAPAEQKTQTEKAPARQAESQSAKPQGARQDGQNKNQNGRSQDGQTRNQDGYSQDGQNKNQNGRGQDGQNRNQDGRSQDGQNRNQSGRSQDGQSRSQGGRSQDGQNRSQGGRQDGQNRSQGGRQDGQNRSRDGRSQDGQSRSQGGRYQDGSQNRSRDGRSQDGQNRSQGGRYQDGGQNRSQGGRYQDGQNRSRDGRSQDGQNRSQGGRYQDGGQGRSQGGRYQDGGQGRSQGGRYQDGGQSRNQGGRSMSIPKPSAEAKPLEKESRKRTERGDRKQNDKGDKLDRLEKNGRPGAKGSQSRNMQKTSKAAKPAPKPVEKQEEAIRNIMIPEKLTIKELGEAMKIQPSAIVKKLFLQGVMVTVNEEIDYDKAEEIALEFNCICEKEEKVDVLEELLKEEEEDDSKMVSRPPVVCVMGHVDHGKTSLLDAIRNTHVIDKEAGGITQHIGAYVVSIDGQKITFLDTPGHEAFTAMRMRGANATDIAILVVAADDGVMPQTVEAISHAKAAGTEIIVAINKIDKPSANIDRVKQELSEYELIPEDWGGNTVFVPVSAHTHEGIDNLLEMILLTAEVAELRANPKRKARGLVIEAELDRGKGPVATVLVQKGTLRVGDPIAAGSCYGKVRAMMDDKGRRVKEAGPSTPVEILGLSDVPNAGEIFIAMDNEKEARSFAETFISEGRERLLEDTKSRMSLDDLYSQIQAGKLKELNIIVKADVQGSVEAVKQSLQKLSNEEVVVKIIHGGVGAINESDVSLASASNAIIIGFNVRPDVTAKATAEHEGVDVRLYRVIYDAIADVESAMKGMLDPIFEEKVIGHAEVRQLFKASGVGTIAGSYVLDGIFQRGCKTRIKREGEVIYDGTLASLKRFKDDVKEVKAGYECGLVFEKFNDIKEEDQVEAYIMVEVPR
jgi:translation initiation factor IF-2